MAIITFHCSHNYGSVLQAYALQSIINELGYNCKIINYIEKNNYEQYRIFRTNYYRRNWKSFIKDIVLMPLNIKRFINFNKFIQKSLQLTSKKYYDEETLKELNDEFDIFVCGSDQIWNIDCTSGKVVKPYFLSFVHDSKLKIAYAPSLAHKQFLTKDNKQYCLMKQLVERFDAVSVREESTVPLFKNITSRNPFVALDPTLLLDVEKYNRILKKENNTENYIFVYLLEDGNDQLIKYCKEIQKRYSLKVYYYSSTASNRRKMRDFKNINGVCPENFLQYIKNAKYVLTNSFHATVFSILFHKQFVSFKTNTSSSRMEDILKKLNLNRIYSEGFDIDEKIDYMLVDERLIELRKNSMDFLKSSLEILERKIE